MSLSLVRNSASLSRRPLLRSAALSAGLLLAVCCLLPESSPAKPAKRRARAKKADSYDEDLRKFDGIIKQLRELDEKASKELA